MSLSNGISTWHQYHSSRTCGNGSNFYSFHVDTPGILELRLEDVPKDMRSFMSLHDKNMGSVAERSASNAGDTLILKKYILGPGWFYLEVRDLDGKAQSESRRPKHLLENWPFSPEMDCQKTGNDLWSIKF
jgi:hypothetical protein